MCWGLTTRQHLWVILCRLPEKGRREIKEIVEEMKEGDRGERKMNHREETEEIKTSPPPLPLQGQQGQQDLPNCKSISVGRPGDVRYTTPSKIDNKCWSARPIFNGPVI